MNIGDCKKLAELLKKISGAMEQMEQVEPATTPQLPPEITEEIFQSPVGFFSQLIVGHGKKEVTVFISPPPSGIGGFCVRDC